MSNPYVQYMYSYPHKTAYGPLEGIDLNDYLCRLSKEENSLYFHIPFCQSKCGYCNLFSVTGQSEPFMAQYVDAMERQAQQLSEVLPEDVLFSDLTLGGGTPLMLPEKQLERIFEIARKYMGFEEGKGDTIVETSPSQTTAEKISILKDHGVTRISMGIQSFFDSELKTLNRSHRTAEVKQALAILKQASFPCVNLDLIYGIPGQTVETLLDSARQAVSYEPEELFVYPLYIKKGTFLASKDVIQPETTYEMYLSLREYLRREGYEPFSMRRFGKRGNIRQTGSCGFDNTISIGCGGRSYIGNLHFCTPFAVRQSRCLELLKDYMNQKDFLTVKHGYILSGEEQKRRYVIKNILFGRGVDTQEYKDKFGSEVEKEFPVVSEWLRQGYAIRDRERIGLTERGFSLSDFLGPMLISDEVREKMEKSEISPFHAGGN